MDIRITIGELMDRDAWPQACAMTGTGEWAVNEGQADRGDLVTLTLEQAAGLGLLGHRHPSAGTEPGPDADGPEDEEGHDLRRRTVGWIPVDDETDVVVQHVFHAEGEFRCTDCGSGHDPGMAAVIIIEDGEHTAHLLLSAGDAEALANRLTRVANLIWESQEVPADIEREAARYAPAAPGTGELS
jgi:hypothetical protein